MVGSHIRHHPTQKDIVQDPANEFHDTDFIIPQDLLKKYIVYSRENIHPQLGVRLSIKFIKLYCKYILI